MSISEAVLAPSERSRRRIIYLSRRFGYPLGGVKISYRHVELLRKNGFDAYILLVNQDDDKFVDVKVPELRPGRDFAVRPNDVYIVPEPWAPQLRHVGALENPSYVFVQNHYYMYHGLRGARSYQELGISGVFCCGDVIADALKKQLHVDAGVVHNGIDLGLYRPLEKKRQIAYMPRKMRKGAFYAQSCFRQRFPELADVAWVEIDKMTEAEVVRHLGESPVFLTLGRMEGFGLPPLEAMASGCAIVGFHGDGGREFATKDNGFWCDPEDWDAVVEGLGSAISDFDKGNHRMIEAGKATAASYGLDRMERELVAFWDQELRSQWPN